MPNEPMSALTAQTGAAVAAADLFETTDVSDTTMAPTGTNKKLTYTQLLAALQTGLSLGSLANLSTITSANITDGTIVDVDISGSAGIAASKISGTALVSAAIGTTVQAHDATLDGVAATSVTVADRYLYSTAADTFTTGTLTAFIRTLLDDADGPTALATLNAQQLAAVQTINVTGDSPVTVVVGRWYAANLSGGNIVYNLPATPANNSRLAFTVTAIASSFTATVNCGGSDRFQTPSTGSTSKVLNRVGQILVLQYHAASAVWLVEHDVASNLVPGYGTAPNTSVQGDVGVDVQLDVQNYTAGTFTWSAPSWSTASSTVEVVVVGGGGSGATGRRGAAGSVRGGGGGGQAGFRSQAVFHVGDLTATVSVTVGAGGVGALAQTVDSNDGLPGNPGNASFFGKYVYASGGAGGAAGTSTDGGVGGTTLANTRGLMPGMPGMKGAGLAAAQDPTASPEFGLFAAGQTTPNVHSSGCGGGGAGTTAANVNAAASAGGHVNGYTDGTAVPGAAATGSLGGSPGVAADPFTATGGGGAGRANTSIALSGGAGGTPGGGGGGGGGATNTFQAGGGGNGGDGFIRVTTRP